VRLSAFSLRRFALSSSRSSIRSVIHIEASDGEDLSKFLTNARVFIHGDLFVKTINVGSSNKCFKCSGLGPAGEALSVFVKYADDNANGMSNVGLSSDRLDSDYDGWFGTILLRDSSITTNYMESLADLSWMH
jgi:methylaspartate ammonia-lyase